MVRNGRWIKVLPLDQAVSCQPRLARAGVMSNGRVKPPICTSNWIITGIQLNYSRSFLTSSNFCFASPARLVFWPASFVLRTAFRERSAAREPLRSHFWAASFRFESLILLTEFLISVVTASISAIRAVSVASSGVMVPAAGLAVAGAERLVETD